MSRRFRWPGEALPVPPPRSTPGQIPRITRADWLTPLTRKIIHKHILVYDFETKDGWSDEPGFDRPFMIGFLDHNDRYYDFWNGENATDPDFRRRAIRKGGCVDTFMRTVFGYPHHVKKTGWRANPEWTIRKADIWSHNGGRFDVTLPLVWLRAHKHDFEIVPTFIHGRVQRLVVKSRRARALQWAFPDSALLLKMTLKEATSLFSAGVQKLKDFDLATPEADRATWRLYNAADCRGLRDAIVGFREMMEEQGGQLGSTAPASATNLFRRAHLQKPQFRARHFPGCSGRCEGCDRGKLCDGECHGCLHAWIRRGAVGGRSEIFARFAPAPVLEVDRNSSYPASALEPMPVGEPHVMGAVEFVETHARLRAEGRLAFVEASVYIPPTCRLPPLPKIVNGKLKFCTGTFSGVWEYDELMLLHEPSVRGKIVNVERAVWFEGERIFESFMKSLYKYRLARPKRKDASGKLKVFSKVDQMTSEEKRAHVLSEFAKLMMNSEVGRHLMNPEREKMVFLRKGEPWPESARPINGRHEDCRIWIYPEYIDAPYIIPHWTARILALGRIAWWRAADAILELGGILYYGDTDSIKASKLPPDEFLDDIELGAWKRENAKGLYAGEFVQPKNYALDAIDGGDSIVHMKGIPRDYQNMRTFMRFRNGEALRWVGDRVSQPKHVLRELENGSDIEGIEMLDSVKCLRSHYDKRIVHADGTTSPIVLDEGVEIK